MDRQAYVCRNGLTVLAEQREEFPLVSLQLWVETGSEHEGEFLGAGVSHLLEHMVFKGTSEYSASELNARVSRLGGLWNAYTSTNRTVFHIDGPSAHWREFLHILVQLVFHPLFPQDEFERERDVIRREMAMYDDDPQDAAYKALISTLYKVHPRRHPVIGEPALFNALTYQDMLTYYRRRYTPGNAFICLAGDVEAAALHAAVEEEMEDIPARPLEMLPPVTEPRQWGSRLFRCEFAQPASTLMLGWRIPPGNHPDTPALSVLCSVLGDGRAAWLYKEFHDDRGLAHDVSATIIHDRAAEGAFIIEADVERGERDALREAILAWMKDLPHADFSQGVERARRQMRAQRLRSQSSVQGMARQLGNNWLHYRNAEAGDEWEEAIGRVTPEDVACVAARYLLSPRMLEVSVDPVGSNGSGTERRGSQPMAPPLLEVLPNGLRVVFRADKRVPVVHACLSLGAGCPAETERNAGIGNLLAECLLKGTETRTASELADAMENLGGSLSCFAGNNTLCLSAQALAEDVSAMLGLMADAALHPVFPQEAVQLVKEDMVADVREADEDPAQVAIKGLRRACYGPVSYGNSPEGTVESLQSLTREDVAAFHRRLMCARNAVLVLVGDFDREEMRAQVRQIFGAMPAGEPVARTATPARQPGVQQVSLGKQQAVLALAVPGFHATDDRLPLQLLFDEWCRDMAGPLFEEIREKRGLAYYALSFSLLGVDAGCLCFYLGTAPDKLDEAREALLETLATIAREGMPEEALEHARATVLTSDLIASQSYSKLCLRMATDTLLGLPPDYGDRLAERLEAVTPGQMKAYIRETLSDPSRTLYEVR